MQLFYNPNISESTSQFTFSQDESKHITRVLRKKEGDILSITNGKGWLFEAEIIVADSKNCIANIIKSKLQDKKLYYLHMAVAPTKMNDRYEWFLEKATEIGIDEITPIICDHSERKQIKKERYEKIIQSAMKQSLNCYLPKINDAVKLNDFLNNSFNGQTFIAHCEEDDFKKEYLNRVALADHKITILIGPEGDFSKNEINLALKKGFVPVSLGDNRLRTETAAIVACHTVSLINNEQ
ncbi:16S rRNA (uracil(1498)-N(3))-methyltransferase [Abyssalbus ytuae]|uniref:Ribosomal RNA small subunit methyltransferase E n=1 Tax=Abyssalbus ytuae TaxID=2926907 RepID=A0A9E7CT01_9FLAO|nr:16S rRNA (uracil(1498)-N(3))-methyltransferase [Abyssalbus ytuae]UOB17156.1 16S rRNA (uracil(1498)-N(3))-methyltransferase [Abyssalbus ytuae]